MLDKLFFELIRVAIGTQEGLSRVPSAKEWQMLYDIAKKQSLVGICFAGVQRLCDSASENYCGMSEMQYLTWMGMAAKIQQRNQIVDEQCTQLQAKFSVDGVPSRILKGQGVASFYGEQLRGLRQSGDIDLWLDLPKEKVEEWAKGHGETEPAGYLHVGCHVFSDTEVELHYRPTYCKCLWHNARMQRFCQQHFKDSEVRDRLVVPSYDFNVVYILSHIYRHLFGLGIGLRQLMDYYCVLRTQGSRGSNGLNGSKGSDGLSGSKDNPSNSANSSNLSFTLRKLGLDKFAGAVMYVMREVFRLEEQYMICPVDEERGKALLRDVMLMGNFGHQDKRQKEARKTMAGSLWWKLKRGVELVRFYPAETLSEPIWKLVRMINK